MDTNAKLTPVFPDSSAPTAVTPAVVPVSAPGLAKGGAVVSTPAPPPADQGPRPGDLRLVIEEDPASGSYVYKTVDRLTGETLKQFPREDVLRLKHDPHYDPGAVFDGSS